MIHHDQAQSLVVRVPVLVEGEEQEHNENSKGVGDKTMDNDTYSKFYSYDLDVDQSQGNKAKEFKLLSMKRPHMRAFHFSWWSYHVAFLMW